MKIIYYDNKSLQLDVSDDYSCYGTNPLISIPAYTYHNRKKKKIIIIINNYLYYYIYNIVHYYYN